MPRADAVNAPRGESPCTFCSIEAVIAGFGRNYPCHKTAIPSGEPRKSAEITDTGALDPQGARKAEHPARREISRHGRNVANKQARGFAGSQMAGWPQNASQTPSALGPHYFIMATARAGHGRVLPGMATGGEARPPVTTSPV